MDPDLHMIACLGFKGGSGRTTTSAALAFGLAAMGQRVALVDAGFAVPLQERFLGQERGFGSPPEHSTLSQWIDAIQVGPTGDGHIQYIRASTVGYLEVVLDQLWEESWTYAVIDTPAHQTGPVTL
jgi:septum formation inhibitor-activating ATPase MinD